MFCYTASSYTILRGIDAAVVEQALRRGAAQRIQQGNEQGISAIALTVKPCAAASITLRKRLHCNDYLHFAILIIWCLAKSVGATATRTTKSPRRIRGHWGVENRCHHVRDVSLHEDASRIRMNPGIFAQRRTWALNGLRHAKHTNIKAARDVLGWDTDQLLNLFSCE